MMRVSTRTLLARIAPVLIITVLSNSLLAKTAAKTHVVDSGSFGVFVNGRRVATETFQIQQQADGSIANSELKADDGSSMAKQKAELLIAGNGNLRRYTWHELSPGKAQDTVEPSEQFLIEHIAPNPPEKPQDQPFLMPISTTILDDYFFSHRQILAWRYLAESCGGTIRPGCKLPRAQYGIIIPRQRTSATVSLEYAGTEQVVIRGTERTLSRFNLVSEGDEWALYFDENFKMLRIVIAAQNTEVLRD